MSGLLKSDFYKLSKMKSFPICLLIVVALTVGSVFIQDYSAQSWAKVLSIMVPISC